MSDETVNVAITATTDELAAGMQRGVHEVQSASKEMQEGFKAAGESFKDLIGIVGVSFSLEGIKQLIDALGEVAHESLEAAEKISNLQQTLGVSAETIQTVAYAANLVGGNIDTATTALTRLDRAAAQANAGNQKLLADFHAIGISSTQLAELIKNPDQLIQVVTQHLAEFGDGANKTAIEMALMGRGAGAMVPLVNSLGENWKGLNEEALRFAGITANDIVAMTMTQGELEKTGEQIKGLKNAFTVEMLPAINAANHELSDFAAKPEIRDGLRDLGDMATYVATHFADLERSFLGGNLAGAITTTFMEGTQAGLNFTNTIKIGFAGIEREAAIIWANIASSAANAFVSIEHYLANVIGGLSLAALLNGQVELSKQLAKTSTDFKNATADTNANSAAIDAANAAYDKYVAGLKVTVGANHEAVTVMDTMVVTADKLKKKILELPDANDAAGKAAEKLLKDHLELDKFLDGLAGRIGGPYEKAWAEYTAAIDQATKMAAVFAHDGMSVAETQQLIAEATELATIRLREKTDADTIIFNLLDTINTKYGEQNRLIGLTGEALAVETEYQRLRTEADKALLSVMGPLTEAQQKEIDGLHGIAEAHVHLSEQAKQTQDLMKSWAGMAAQDFDQAFGAINKDIIEGGSIMKDLVNVAKTVVEQILLQFEKLAIINPMLKAIFGESAGNLPTMGSMAGGGGGSGNGLFGNLLNSWFGGGGGGGSSMMAGEGMLLQGGASAFAGASAAGYGSSPLMSQLGITSGEGYGATSAATSAGGGISTAGVVGGVLAGIGEYQAAGGGAGGIAGGIAYGVGTYFATAAVTAGMGAAAAGGISAGMAAGFAAIPVIGWIALAAMAINMISGGKLFGTAGKPIGGNETETIGPDGANISAEMTFKGQKPLFGGAKYSEHKIPIDAAAQKAADDFLAALVKGRDDFATQFGVEMGDIVGGSFHQTLDKHGKVTGTDSTVLGVNYKGDTEQQFMERLQADNYLAVLDKMGLGASAFVQGMQGDADKLFAAVQDFASATQAANTNLGKGFKFMAMGADETLVSVMAFVEGMQQGGETLSAAYNRLAQAQQAYDQFTGQFKPAPTYVDPFEASIAKLFDQMKAAQAQANALAIAAGATSANISDLVNIQKTYASQMAALTVQLEQGAQQLAFSLGLTNIGTLDQINAEIQALTTPTQSATTATQNFGNAMKQVSQKASDAINLLLGNLSPLNDQEKLQVALQGLRAGTVTQEQVLTIGRNLYASSEAYNNLFAQVQQYPNHQQGGARSGGHSGSSTTTVILSAEDQAKLDELKSEKATLEAANKLNQFQTLAQQIEEIAQAKGETVDQVVKEMGLNLKDFEKGLGLKDDKAFNDYMDSLAAQMDSNKENTASIVGAILSLPQAIANAIQGKPSGNVVKTSPLEPVTPPVTDPGTTNPGPIRGGGRMSDHEFVRALGNEFRDVMGPITNAPAQFASRNARAYVN